MRILMVGDVVGKRGREATLDLVPALRREHQIDFVIVNGENAAAGIGITPELVATLASRRRAGHHARQSCLGKREIYPTLDSEPRLLRPANYPPGAPGRGHGVFDSPAGPVGVICAPGPYVHGTGGRPVPRRGRILEGMRCSTSVIVVDFHAEATSEKQAFGWYVDGRVSAVIGTHTHVQTADERILPGGTAYLTDVGMTGPMDSIIGMRRDIVIAKFLSGLPAQFEVADDEAQLCAVVLEIDPATGRARSIRRIQSPPHRAQMQM